MSFLLVQGGDSPRWVKWVDEANARAHLAVIKYVLDHAGAIETEDAATQLRRTRELYAGIRGFALAVDMDPLDAAPYAPARLTCDAGQNDWPGLYESPGTWYQAAFAVVRGVSEELREAIADGEDVNFTVWPRVDLSASVDRAVVLRTEPPETPQGTDLTRANGGNAWTDYGWREWHPGLLEASHTHEVSVLLPLRLSWELAAQCGRLMLARGLEGTVSLSATWVMVRNIRLAVVVGGTGLPEDIVRASAAVDVAALGSGVQTDGTRLLVGIASGVAAAINPIAGVVVGLMLGLETLLEAAFGRAAVTASDVWGRRQPYLARLDFTGTILPPRQAPTLAPPAPIFWVGSYSDGMPLRPYAPVIPSKSSGPGKAVAVGVGLAAAYWLLG